MINWSTPVDVGRSRAPISFSRPMLILGSCFADNVGGRMASVGFDAIVNPLGTTYNPMSVCNSLERIATGRPFEESECTTIGAGDGRICTFDHHTRNARPTIDEFIADANASLAAAHSHWLRTGLVIITLGTAWCFRHNGSGKIVSNCLKHHPDEFTRFRMTYDECKAATERIVSLAEGRDIIFTVSPIRHKADGAHGNQLSKATLLMAVDATIEAHRDQADYFPSYEIMMDELRDYRFYADDMAHPTPLAENYIFERFMDFGLVDKERQLLAEGIKRGKRLGHREMH